MCKCEQLNKGSQLFRIQSPTSKFKELHDIGPDHKMYLGARKIWQCNLCGQLFAYMRIPYKDEEEIIVRAHDSNWNDWDWNELANIADSVRWQGPDKELKCLW